jgi:hypothetical protein
MSCCIARSASDCLRAVESGLGIENCQSHQFRYAIHSQKARLNSQVRELMTLFHLNIPT